MFSITSLAIGLNHAGAYAVGRDRRCDGGHIYPAGANAALSHRCARLRCRRTSPRTLATRLTNLAPGKSRGLWRKNGSTRTRVSDAPCHLYAPSTALQDCTEPFQPKFQALCGGEPRGLAPSARMVSSQGCFDEFHSMINIRQKQTRTGRQSSKLWALWAPPSIESPMNRSRRVTTLPEPIL